MKKTYIYLALTVGLLAALYGYYEYNRPVKGIANDKTEVTVDAKNLLDDYTLDEAAANQKYYDKIIEVKGIVSKIETTDTGNSIYINADNELSYIICEMENSNDAKSIKEGDNVTIKGKCTGYLSDVILVQSVIKN
jgi:hypothetical protein